ARLQQRAVHGGGCLTGAAADAGRAFALGILRGLLVAVGQRAFQRHGIEAYRLARIDAHAVEARERHAHVGLAVGAAALDAGGAFADHFSAAERVLRLFGADIWLGHRHRQFHARLLRTVEEQFTHQFARVLLLEVVAGL